MNADRNYQTERDKKRDYRRKHPIVFLTLCFIVGLIFLLPVLEKAPSVLEKQAGSYVSLIGTVRESREGNGYLWLKLKGSDEQVCVYLPGEWEEQKTALWYPAGSELRVSGILEKPQGRQNPGGFDEAAWLLSKKARMKLSSDEITVLNEPQGVWKVAWKAQCSIRKTVSSYLSEEQSAVALAVLLGEKQQMDQTFYRMTQRMGIAHIFAVSGLHVGFAGTMLMFLFRLFHRERSWISFLGLSAGLGFYCVLTGLAPSSVRAALMILLAALAMRLLRPPAAVDFMALAALILLLDNPFLLYTAGFQLSFGVTMALLVFVRPIRNLLHRISIPRLRDSLAVVLSASIGSIPLTAWHFYMVSFLAPVYNLFMVPVVSVLVPALLLSVLAAVMIPGGGSLFFLPVKLLLAILIQGTELLEKTAGTGHWYIGKPDFAAVICFVLFLIFFWCRLQNGENCKKSRYSFDKKTQNRWCAGSLFLTILFSIPSAPANHELLYLDAGQGSCAVLHTRAGETVIFDGGTKQQELASVLAWYGINEITAMILSHGDSDHTGGIVQVLENMPVEYLCMEKSQMKREETALLLDAAVQSGTQIKPVENGANITLQDGFIQLKSINDGKNDTNSRELTACVKIENQVIAFPGDLGAEGVEQFVNQLDRITVWTVPHHGSRFSASAEIYSALKQKGTELAVISAGRENRYGHPHAEVLAQLAENGIAVHRIDREGALLLEIGAEQS